MTHTVFVIILHYDTTWWSSSPTLSLLLRGVEAQLFEVRSNMDGSTFFYIVKYNRNLRAKGAKKTVAPDTD